MRKATLPINLLPAPRLRPRPALFVGIGLAILTVLWIALGGIRISLEHSPVYGDYFAIHLSTVI